MSAPDPTTVGLTLQASAALGKEAEDFAAALLGQPGKTIGTIFGEWARERIKNLATITRQADLTLLNIGLTSRVDIPFNIVVPIAEAASLQDDSELQVVWANLLANAADPRQVNPVLPSFASILKELTPREVKFLHALRRRSSPKVAFQEPQSYDRDTLQTIYVEAGLARCSFLGKVMHRAYSEQENEDLNRDENEFAITFNLLRRHGIIDEITYVTEGYGMNTRLLHKYALSELGFAFVDACQSPKATPETAER